MLLKKYTDGKSRLALSQIFCVCALVGLTAGGAFGGDGVLGLFFSESRALDFTKGFLTGISSAALGLSLVFAVAAFITIKRETASRVRP